MKKRTIYESFDGTTFQSELECVKYEEKHIKERFGDYLKVYNDENEEIDISYPFQISHNSAYVVCKNKEAFDYFNSCCKDNNCVAISDLYEEPISYPVVFMYNYGTNEWINIKAKIAEYQAEIDKLKKYMEV